MRVALLLALVASVSCDAGSPQRDRARPAKVRLGYFANVTHAQAVLGVHSGDFADAVQPLALSTRVVNAGPALIEALFAGEIDIGYVGPGPAISAFVKSQGNGIRVISGSAANGVVIVAAKDSGIESLADLRGKRIATPQHGNTQDIAARFYMIDTLQQPDANNVLAIPTAEQSALMQRGRIDVAWAPEPWGSRLIAETGGTLVAEEKDLWPQNQFALTVIVTTPEFLASHPDVVKSILRVHTSWTQRLAANPQQYASELEVALFNLTGKKLPPGVLAQSLEHVTFLNDPLEPTFHTMARWAHELGFVRSKPNLDGMFDTSMLEQVQ